MSALAACPGCRRSFTGLALLSLALFRLAVTNLSEKAWEKIGCYGQSSSRLHSILFCSKKKVLPSSLLAVLFIVSPERNPRFSLQMVVFCFLSYCRRVFLP